MVYEEIGDFTTTDWTIFGLGITLLAIGIFLSGQKMKTVLMVWDRRNFVGFSTMMGLGLLGAWLAVRLDEGNLDFLFDADVSGSANLFGMLSSLVLAAAIASASIYSKDSPIPQVFGVMLGAVGWGILFGSALTISVQQLYNDAYVPVWDAYPLFPMNEIYAAVYATVLLSITSAAVVAIVNHVRGASEGQAGGKNIVAGLLEDPSRR
jgi:hypothetical protein